jgi:cytochrome c oxidase assembly factor CtaG/polyferredoxin
MSATAAAILLSWQLAPGTLLAMALGGALYGRGFRLLHRQLPARFPCWRLYCFMGGLALVWIAVASPLDSLSDLLLQVHMIQHLLLMFVAPALLLLGAPANPLLRGLPPHAAREGLGPFLRAPAIRRLGAFLGHPIVCWCALAVATWGWHMPGPYQAALRSPGWHALEHGCFLAAGLMFWWPVIQPWPSVPVWPRWAMIPYLLLAELQNSVLAAFFAFSDRVLYPFYAHAPRLFGIGALSDQVVAGAIMWVPASLIFLLPAVAIVLELLSPAALSVKPAQAARPGHALGRAQPGAKSFDLLRVPLVGPLLRTRYFRRGAQGAMLLIAALVVIDGLWGPQMAPMNLAGVLPWTYWRALLIVALMTAGNLFCLACPFTLPRELARRLGSAGRRWPSTLRSKWLALSLLIVFFVAYEVFAPWDSPAATAWLIIAYFVVAVVVDTLFSGASFCRYVCPIGNFEFIQSLVSPLEVRIRSPQTCASCTTHDCIRGNQRNRGCELDLYLPRKASNLDCTFCLDCIKACPYDNVGILATPPARTLLTDPQRAALGRFSRRPDIVAMALVLSFAAFANAAAMIAPVTAGEAYLGARLKLPSTAPVAGAMLLLIMLGAPALAYHLAWLASRGAVHARGISPREVSRRLALSLVPIGLAMWAAHFLFHLSTGFGSAIPVIQRAARAAGIGWLGIPRWEMMTPALGPQHLLALQLLLLDGGVLISLYLAWRIARQYAPPIGSALRLTAPWAVVALILYLGGVWIVLQPMQMRGTMQMRAPIALTNAARGA